MFRFTTDLLKTDALKEILVNGLDGEDIFGMFSFLSLFFIIMGFVIFIVGGLGCCGAFCSNRVLLVLVSITIQSTLSKWSPLLSSRLYWKVTLFLSCHRKFHMNWSSVLKDHYFLVPKGDLFIQDWPQAQVYIVILVSCIINPKIQCKQCYYSVSCNF